MVFEIVIIDNFQKLSPLLPLNPLFMKEKLLPVIQDF